MSAVVGNRKLVPPELAAAFDTLNAARADALPTVEARRERMAFYFVLLAIGNFLGLGLLSLGLVGPADKDLWRSGLTAVSVLSGFMIATMLFTGKVEVAKSLSLTELRDVASKANYLLLYQFGTLINHFVCLMAMLLMPAINSRWPAAADSAAVLACGLFFVSLMRSVLIPLQIIELHRFTHAALLREKREDASKIDDL